MNGKRTVFITGGTRGIGRALVHAFAEKGYNVAFCYKSSEEEACKIVRELTDRQVNVLSVKCDVSDFDSVENAYKATRSHFGFADTVVNNAGISRYALFTDESEKDFDEIVGVNLKSVFNVCKKFVPDMVSNKFGRIVNISSVWGVYGASMETLYSMTKAGVIGLTKALAKELAPSGITVNSVAPGFIDTDMNARFSVSERKAITDGIAVGRAGTVGEVASAVLYLADKESGFITGEVINVNGGVI